MDKPPKVVKWRGMRILFQKYMPVDLSSQLSTARHSLSLMAVRWYMALNSIERCFPTELISQIQYSFKQK